MIGGRKRNTQYRTGGTRGGAAYFDWETVKDDKYREHYLGHSVKASVGRWQKGKDLTWYEKLSKEDKAAAAKEEAARVKAMEEAIMNEELGLQPKAHRVTKELTADDKKELFRRGQDENEEDAELHRVAGLGAAPARYDPAARASLMMGLVSGAADDDDDIHQLPGTGIYAGGAVVGPGGVLMQAPSTVGAGAGAGAGSGAGAGAAAAAGDSHHVDSKDKKDRKSSKKSKKSKKSKSKKKHKHKHSHKKHKKHKRRRSRSGSTSRSRSRSPSSSPDRRRPSRVDTPSPSPSPRRRERHDTPSPSPRRRSRSRSPPRRRRRRDGTPSPSPRRRRRHDTPSPEPSRGRSPGRRHRRKDGDDDEHAPPPPRRSRVDTPSPPPAGR